MARIRAAIVCGYPDPPETREAPSGREHAYQGAVRNCGARSRSIVEGAALAAPILGKTEHEGEGYLTFCDNTDGE